MLHTIKHGQPLVITPGLQWLPLQIVHRCSYSYCSQMATASVPHVSWQLIPSMEQGNRECSVSDLPHFVIPISISQFKSFQSTVTRRRRFWHATHDCVAPYVDIILHRGRFWAKSAASWSVRWWLQFTLLLLSIYHFTFCISCSQSPYKTLHTVTGLKE